VDFGPPDATNPPAEPKEHGKGVKADENGRPKAGKDPHICTANGRKIVGRHTMEGRGNGTHGSYSSCPFP
jgi:hypothetical protein